MIRSYFTCLKYLRTKYLASSPTEVLDAITELILCDLEDGYGAFAGIAAVIATDHQVKHLGEQTGPPQRSSKIEILQNP